MFKTFRIENSLSIPLSAALVALLLVQTNALAITRTSKSALYVVEQQESNGNKRTICLSKTGIKVISRERVLTATAPDWNTIVISNKRSHQYCKVPIDKFDGCEWFEKLPINKLKLQEAEVSRKVAGQSVARFSETESEDPKSPKEKSAILVSTQLPITEQEKTVIAKLFGVKPLDGLPLSVKVTTADGGTDERLETLWCLGRPEPKSFFAIPRSFVVATSRANVESSSAKPFVRDRKNAPSSH